MKSMTRRRSQQHQPADQPMLTFERHLLESRRCARCRGWIAIGFDDLGRTLAQCGCHGARRHTIAREAPPLPEEMGLRGPYSNGARS